MAFNRNVKVTTAHLPSQYNWKFWLKCSAVIAILASIIIFPEEIGSFIGYWSNEFGKGFKGINE